MPTKYLDNVICEIDQSYPHLGNLVVVAMLVVKANRLLLVVSPRGCGKSRVSEFVGRQARKSLIKDRISVAGLSKTADEFSHFDGVLVVDDIAKGQTPYARITTITTLAELVYGHSIASDMSRGHFKVEGFNGSALINIQPVLLREIVRSSEWEASIQDKAIRYYHLYRPLNPNPKSPELKLKWGLKLDSVADHYIDSARGVKLLKHTEIQWSLARQKEHLSAMLRASAALNRRTEVDDSDYALLERVLAPLRVEGLCLTKSGFESGRDLNANQLAILTEFVTYGQFTLEMLARDYKVAESTAYKIIDEQTSGWRVVSKSPTTYAPDERLQARLEELGLWVKESMETTQDERQSG